MSERILKRLELCAEAKKIQLPYELFGEFTEDLLLDICKEINVQGLGSLLGGMKTENVKRLIMDAGFLKHVNKLLQSGVSSGRIEDFISGAGTEQMSQYDYPVLEEVMKDQEIMGRYQYRFLKYYHKYNLSMKQKESLMGGFDFLDKHTEMDIQQLSEEERELLWEPVLCTRLLKPVGNVEGFWTMLLDKGALPLLDYLSEQCRSHCLLNPGQFLQLTENPDAILQLLKETLPFLEETGRSSFIDIWLENEALQYDLKKLSGVIKDMDEEEIRQVTRNRAAYIGAVYGTELKGMELDHIDGAKERILIYAITNRKKRFLALVREQFPVFASLPWKSLLLDPDFYKSYVNINTLNKKNLEECRNQYTVPKDNKPFMKRKEYTFDEVKLLSQQPMEYTVLYHQLLYNKSDDRLRVLRELVKRNCLEPDMPEDELSKAAAKLSEKSLSSWMQKELCHITGLRPQTAIHILSHWEELERFIGGISQEVQAAFLLRNMEMLDKYQGFHELKERIVEIDQAWKSLCEAFQFDAPFIKEHREMVETFLFEGGAEIMYTFYKEEPGKREEVRRLIIAELLGKFRELKYHADDLRKEIDFPISGSCEQEWMKNYKESYQEMEAWEEDRLLPVMQIGEVPDYTCMSYRSGQHKECLLSCFDANKKVVFLSRHGKTVFRAIARLTKGTFSYKKREKPELEFVDMLQEKEEKKEQDGKKTEEMLTLFLERPYIRGIPGDKINLAVQLVISMLVEKAKKLNAQLVLSRDYDSYSLGKDTFVSAAFFMYISTSKNGLQYLDSLGGEASVSRSGSYDKGRFLIFNNGKASGKEAA